MKLAAIALVKEALSGRIPMLILRGDDPLARKEGDLDILVPSGLSVKACQLIAGIAKAAGWYLLCVRNIGYVVSVTLVKPAVDGCDTAIKLDLISGLEWYGIGSGECTREYFALLGNGSADAGSSELLVAFATFLQKVAAVGRLSDRDWSRVNAGAPERGALLAIGDRVGIHLCPSDLMARGVTMRRKWQLRASSAGNHGVVEKLLWFPRVAVAHLSYKIGVSTATGFILGLSGLDGSGKSTQMERLFSAYRLAGGIQPRLVHLLPEWIPMPHQLIRRKKTEENYARPYSELPVKSNWSALARLGYYVVSFTIAKAWIGIAAVRGQVVVLDRCFTDFAADLTRARIPGLRLPLWLVRLCAPRGRLLFLDVLPQTAVSRKGELDLDRATYLRQRYLNVFGVVDGEVISAEGAPDVVFSRILERIDRVYQDRLRSMVDR